MTFLRREENNDLFSLTVSLKVHTIASVLSVNECLQHRILGFANGTTVRQLLVLPYKLGISDDKNAYSEGPEDGRHMVRSQGCMVDVQDSSIQIAATWVSFASLCGVLAPNDFYLFGPLNKYLHGRRCRSYVEVQGAILQLFHLQSLELGAEGTHLVITCDSCMNLQSGYVEKYVIFFSHKKWYIEQKVAK